MSAYDFEITDADGWSYTDGLMRPGLSVLTWQLLQYIGYTDCPTYCGWDGKRYSCSVYLIEVTVAAHPGWKEWPMLDYDVVSRDIRDGVDKTACGLLLQLCQRHHEQLEGTQFELLPVGGP